MSTNSNKSPTVLIVDDEQDLADMYSLHLEEIYTVRTAYDGTQALETVDDDVDVILLDRRMPGLSGKEVLEKVRTNDYDCRVIMVTAVDPEVDIIDMPFDDYLCKPIQKETIRDAIEQQLAAKEYDKTVSMLFRATSKLKLLEAEKTAEELKESSEYQHLKQKTTEIRTEAESLMDELEDCESAFKAIDRSSGWG